MKKITLLSLLISGFFGTAQQKTTGNVMLSTNMGVSLTLDNGTSTAILSFTGPNDRWFALQFGSFATGDGMAAGQDVVYWNNTTLVDAVHNGSGVMPSDDATNNWTIVSNVNNSPSTGLRTVVYSRPLSTGDSNDYTFNYADSTIDFAWARRSNAGFTLNNHTSQNRGYVLDVPLTVLGNQDFSIDSSYIFPNPTVGSFYVKSLANISNINIYNQTGALVKEMTFENNNNDQIEITGLSTGVYFLEIKNDTHKTWKKVVIN